METESPAWLEGTPLDDAEGNEDVTDGETDDNADETNDDGTHDVGGSTCMVLLLQLLLTIVCPDNVVFTVKPPGGAADSDCPA